MKSKYRIVEHPWVGLFSNKVRTGYVIEKKYWLFGWAPYGSGIIFDYFSDAEDYLNSVIFQNKTVVREY